MIDKQTLECLLSGAKHSISVEIGTALCRREGAVCPYKNDQFKIFIEEKQYDQCDYRPRLTFAYINWLNEKNE